MPSADSSPVLRIEHGGAEPDQLLGRAGIGDRDQDPAGERRAGRHAPPPDGVPALHEVRLQQLELARLTLDAILGLFGRDVPVLDDERPDPTEVDRHERRDERLERMARVPRRQDEVVDDPRPEVVGEVVGARRFGHLEGRRARRRDVTADPELRPGGVAEATGLLGQLEHRVDGLRRRASSATCRRGSASRRGTPRGGGACSPRAAAGR